MTADDVFSLATWVGVFALAIGVLCAAAIAVSGKLRDDRLTLELEQARERTAAFEATAESLRAENLRMQRENAGRSLTDQQSKAISDAARGKVAEAVILWSNNPEASSYAMDIDFALANGGVTMHEPQLVGTPRKRFPDIDSNIGITVYEPSAQKSGDQLSGPLVAALKAGGLLVNGSAKPDLAEDLPEAPIIIVGSKTFSILPGKTY